LPITTGSKPPIPGAAKLSNTPVKAESNQAIKNPAAQLQQATNLEVLRAAAKVSLRSNNDSLSLLYKTALENINAKLEPIMGPNAAQKIYDSATDTSPEATADRILSFATGFYSRYKELSPDKSEQENLDNFLTVISGGIEKGFTAAKNILQSLRVYEGEVESGVDKTYDLVTKGLTAFREKMLALATRPALDASDN
jgi:hypothetical protein